MTKRTIMIFPKFNNLTLINDIRQKYDPLFKCVDPHISLVFSFETDLSKNELKEHISESISSFSPFKLSMKNIVKIDNDHGKYLFLLPSEGINDIKEMSEELYHGKLSSIKPDWLNKDTYLPHLTLGVFNDSSLLDKAYNEVTMHLNQYETIVDQVSCEIIDSNELSIVDIVVPLSS